MMGRSTTSNQDDPSDDDAATMLDIDRTVKKMLATVGYPALRLLLALAVVWIASGVSS